MKIVKILLALVVVLVVGVLLGNYVIKQNGGGAVNVKVEQVVNAPLTEVFSQLADHANWQNFPGVSESELIQPGRVVRNGVGAVRRISAPGFTAVEEITGFVPLARIRYQIIESSPIRLKHDYALIVLRAETLNSTRVIWETRGVVDVPLVDAVLGLLVAAEVKQSFTTILQSMNR